MEEEKELMKNYKKEAVKLERKLEKEHLHRSNMASSQAFI